MPSRLLTADERSRLRPTVDVSILEHLLDRLGPGDRMELIWACQRDPSALVAGISEELAELMRGDSRIVARSSKLTNVDGQIRFADSELQALWDAVEPPPNGAA